MRGVIRHRIVDQLGKMRASLDRVVDFKMQRRNRTNRQPLGKLHPQEPGGAIEPFSAGRRLLIAAELREEYLGVRVIAGQINAGQCHHGDPRIAHVEPDELRELALDLIRDLAVSGFRHGMSTALSGIR